MDRNQAVNYLKDLLKICNDMSPEALSFENLQTSDYDGYCVRIKGKILTADKQIVREIAEKHRLNVKEEKGEVLVYTPKQTV
jgi:hypothetical protein